MNRMFENHAVVITACILFALALGFNTYLGGQLPVLGSGLTLDRPVSHDTPKTVGALNHGPTFPPSPWRSVQAQHGPTFPPSPWRDRTVAHGPTFPPSPWRSVQSQHGPTFPPSPWRGRTVAHGPTFPPSPWHGRA